MENSEIYKESIGKLLRETDDIVFEIRSLRRDNKNATMENDKKITEFEKKLAEIEATMEKTLIESKKDDIKPKCGWAHFRVIPDIYVFSDEAIEEIEIEYPESEDKYIKTSKSLRLNPLKKDIDSDKVSLKNYTKEPQKKKFEYKYTG